MSKVDPTAYPALFDLTSGEMYSLADCDQFVAGRSQDADLPLLDVTCSRRQFQLNRQSDTWTLENFSSSAPTLHQGEAFGGSVELVHGAQIQAGHLVFRFMTKESSDDAAMPKLGASASLLSEVTHAPVPAAGDRTIIGDSRIGQAGDLAHSGPVHVLNQMLIGRDKGRVQIHLDDRNVSRMHAQIFAKPEGLEINDLTSTNGTFVNGQRIESAVKLTTGDRIDIGPATLICDGQVLHIRSRANNIELIGRDIRHEVTDRATRKPLELLDGINVVIRPREFVCLLGPSGSGKSTLLSALSARVPATSGSVTLNNEDLYSNFESLKQDIAVVPQKDVMHELLPVQMALQYTARLRLPADTSDQEIESTTLTMLGSVGLSERRGTSIRDLSGGQLKRASLANETISSPSLLFLDEVTSGLDEQTDREMMQLFRKVADDGKTVVCITHSVANVERNCDLIVVLTVGGKLAFIGTPAEVRDYFSIEYLGDIYEKLAEKPAKEWKDAFEQHAFYSKYIDARMPASDSEPEFAPRRKRKFDEQRKLFQHQLRLLVSRYLKIQLADRQALAVMIGQCVLVGVLLCLLFGDLGELDSSGAELARKSQSLLFLMAVSCLWFSCNNAAKEIVKERDIFEREHDVNLLSSAYYGSKLLLLGATGIIQSILLLTIVCVGTGVSGNFIAYVFELTLLSSTGTALGLLISVSAKTEDQAVTLVPLVLIPQIVLAGVIASLSGWLETFSQLTITAYWGMRTLVPTLDEPLPEQLGAEEWSTMTGLVMLCMHFVVFVAVAQGIQFLRDRRNIVYGRAVDEWMKQAKTTLGQKLKQRVLKGKNNQNPDADI
jgi:ABC transport system ATP-binding/permease protein